MKTKKPRYSNPRQWMFRLLKSQSRNKQTMKTIEKTMLVSGFFVFLLAPFKTLLWGDADPGYMWLFYSIAGGLVDLGLGFIGLGFFAMVLAIALALVDKWKISAILTLVSLLIFGVVFGFFYYRGNAMGLYILMTILGIHAIFSIIWSRQNVAGKINASLEIQPQSADASEHLHQ